MADPDEPATTETGAVGDADAAGTAGAAEAAVAAPESLRTNDLRPLDTIQRTMSDVGAGVSTVVNIAYHREGTIAIARII